ncbi:diguanylate cyclase DgcA [Treponema sp.]|uniref:diguanylate cyclase DgcA n=1 Tax=Treponema sp. TaxID=166 RepID=UPI00298D6AA8|nr:diguanylate cyclase DgcA [Treponema sp.]
MSDNLDLVQNMVSSSLLSQDSMQDAVEMYEKRIYDLQQLLEISRSLCSTLEYNTLIESILYTCMSQMHVMGAGIFVLDDIDSNSFNLATNHAGIDLNPTVTYSIDINRPVIKLLASNNDTATIASIKQNLGNDCDIKEFESLAPTLIVPLFHKNHMNGILVLGERLDLGEGTEYSEYDKNQILAIASLAAVAINNAALLEKSSTDMMTHLKLKYFFYNILTDKLALAISQSQNIAVLMFDIDFFKKFNDTWGHACGDFVLKSVAKIIKSNTRENDVASRYGGEEFTVMLPDTSKEDAMAVAERIRKQIEEKDFEYEGQHMKVTISIGCAVYDSQTNPVSNPKDLVEQADKALYVSKRNGRNRVSFANADVINSIEVQQ